MINTKQLYDTAAERLWEKIEFRREGFDMDCVDDRVAFPWDQFSRANPTAEVLAAEVNSELNYELSEAQCSWAVNMAVKNVNMDTYNSNESTALTPRE